MKLKSENVTSPKLLRNKDPINRWIEKEPPRQEDKNLIVRIQTGSLTRLKDRDTDWHIGCSESESGRCYFGGCPMRKGGPEASLSFELLNGEAPMPPSGPVGRVISCRGFAFLIEGTTVHTARQQNPLSK